MLTFNVLAYEFGTMAYKRSQRISSFLPIGACHWPHARAHNGQEQDLGGIQPLRCGRVARFLMPVVLIESRKRACLRVRATTCP